MNPYLTAYREALEHQREHDSREVGERPWLLCLCDEHRGHARASEFIGVRLRYAWAIPNRAAIETIKRASPHGVVELGAGGGYWAWQLRQSGVDVVAYDPGPDRWFTGTPWTHVERGDHRVAADHPDRTLLLVWPQRDWAARAVEQYAGSTVVFVGQPQDRPPQLSDPVRLQPIPRWRGFIDQLEVYSR